MWLLLSSIYRGTSDIQGGLTWLCHVLRTPFNHKRLSSFIGAIFALQCCVQYNNEVANYWVELAKGYACLSGCCGNINNLSLSTEDNNQQTLSANNSQTALDVQRYNQREHSTLGREVTNSLERGIVPKIDELTLSESRATDEYLKDCASKEKVFNENTMEDEKQYVHTHRNCFCVLCCLLIAR